MDFQNVRLPVRVGLPFAALAIGFLGAVLYVPLALRPLTQRAEVIQHELAESVRHLSGVRAYARDIRSEALLLAYEIRSDPSFDRGPRVEAIAVGRAGLRQHADAYAPLPRSDEEEAIWRRVRDVDLPALDEAVDRTLRTEDRPDARPSALRQLLETGSSLDERLRRLVDLNVTATQVETAMIHENVRRLSIAYVVLAALGAAGALLLVPQIVRLLRTYQSSVGNRLAELEAFAGQVSHDLRTPLQAIHLAVHAIDRVADDAEGVRRLAQRATAGVRRLDGMIQDLLQFARSGAAGREDGRADVREVLAELSDELGGHAQRANVRLTMQAESVVARIPPVALRTVLANLVENAIKYRKPDVENEVVVNGGAHGEEVVLRVEDTGVGIPPAALPRIFEPFFRGTRRPAPQGASGEVAAPRLGSDLDSHGLGLATVKRLVDAHRGTISVRSEVGRGTTFEIRLPRAAPERPPLIASEARP